MAALIINTSELVDVQGQVWGRVTSTLDGQWLASRDGHPGTLHHSQLAAFNWLMALADATEVPLVPEKEYKPAPVTYEFPPVGFGKGR